MYCPTVTVDKLSTIDKLSCTVSIAWRQDSCVDVGRASLDCGCLSLPKILRGLLNGVCVDVHTCIDNVIKFCESTNRIRDPLPAVIHDIVLVHFPCPDIIFILLKPVSHVIRADGDLRKVYTHQLV